MKEEQEQEQEPMDVGAIQKPIIEKPIHISLEGKTVEYRCGNCDIAPTRSKLGMDAHIRSVHTKKALLCSFCVFSTYNFDSLNRHMKDTTRAFFVLLLVGDVTVTTSMGG